MPHLLPRGGAHTPPAASPATRGSLGRGAGPGERGIPGGSRSGQDGYAVSGDRESRFAGALRGAGKAPSTPKADYPPQSG